MFWPLFKTNVPGKWVLAGEHSVLRGGTAIALPYAEVGLTLSFEPGQATDGFSVMPQDAESLIKKLLSSVGTKLPNGKLTIESTIPIGAGLGSSAALCVALTQWLSEPLGIPSDRRIEFATQLEHHFHGRSSGMDVTVISMGEAVTFQMGQRAHPLGLKRLPKFSFHDTGLRSATQECILAVAKFREQSLAKAIQMDQNMDGASHWVREGLMLFDSDRRERGLQFIQKGMQQARECFHTWGLVPEKAKLLENQLISQGALAVKLTGAGGGGMVVALWGEAGQI